MWNCLRLELHRMFRSKGLLAALAIGLLFTGSHIITIVLPYAKMNEGIAYDNPMCIPFSACMFFMGYDMYGWQGQIYYRLLPLLAAIPYANSYFCDISQGYIKNLQVRCKKKHYLTAKYLVTFISGGITVVTPLIVDYLLCLAFLPVYQPIRSTGLYAISFVYFYYTHTIIYILLFLAVDFVIGGLYAVLGLLGAEIIANKYLIVIFPYLFVAIFQMIIRILNLGAFDPEVLAIPEAQSGEIYHYIIVILLGLLITFGVYFIRGIKKDEVV